MVTTEDNTAQGSLADAISNLHDGDIIQFNIPGPAPHTIQTPEGGYPYITANNVTIDGYSQPGSFANSNPILAPNNAQIGIILDSRNGNYKLMDYAGYTPNDDTGFSASEAAILGVIDATNLTVRGISFLGPATVGPNQDISLYSVALARLASGAHISGNWFGLSPDGTTVAGTADGIAGFRYQGRDENAVVTNVVTIDNTVIGVSKNSTNAPADFNIFVGQPTTPIVLEGNGTRISGNYIMVLPNGTSDYNVTDLVPGAQFQGAIRIGPDGNNTLIGVDGDGTNDDNERNVIGGAYPAAKGGYDHTIEFYNQNGTNIVIAGNYIGLGIDGSSRFTNGVPALNASGSSARFRFGSDFDGVSDGFEGNIVANNWPPDIFDPTEFAAAPDKLNFFDELETGGMVSVRGNALINNFPSPASILRDNGSFLSNYMSKVLLDPSKGFMPTLAASNTTDRISGTVPLPANGYSVVVDLYSADPEGIQTGQQSAVPEFTKGWVQGKRYLGSFTVDGTKDQNSATGAFDFDISALKLTTNLPVTIAANYILGAPAIHNARALTSPFSDAENLLPGSSSVPPADIKITSFTQTGNSLTLSWTGGNPPFTVQQKPALDATSQWTTASTTSQRTAMVTMSGKTGFLRIAQNGP
jgi:hypothetical protein